LFSLQGGWEDDETVTEAACREALEEAGVKGIVRVSLFNISMIFIIECLSMNLNDIALC